MLLCCYSEVFRSSHQSCSLRTPFLQNTFRRLLLSFYKKILTNLQNVRQTKAQKRFIYGEKKAKHGTEGNELKCQLLKAQQRLIRVKTVGCFCRGAPSLMFARILNATLSEKVSTTGVTQDNLELPLLPNSLDLHQTQNSKMKFWTDTAFLLPSRRTHPLGR